MTRQARIQEGVVASYIHDISARHVTRRHGNRVARRLPRRDFDHRSGAELLGQALAEPEVVEVALGVRPRVHEANGLRIAALSRRTAQGACARSVMLIARNARSMRTLGSGTS